MSQRLKVTREQFDVASDCVMHRPTGSWFAAHPGEAKPCREYIRIDALLNSDNYYLLFEIREVGCKLLSERLTRVSTMSRAA
jgi:hypothetical protein